MLSVIKAVQHMLVAVGGKIGGVVPRGYEISAECASLATDIRETVDVGREPLVRRWRVAAATAVGGTVVTPSGRAVAGVKVQVQPVGEPAARRGSICSTDASGEFSCPGLASGVYSAHVSRH